MHLRKSALHLSDVPGLPQRHLHLPDQQHGGQPMSYLTREEEEIRAELERQNARWGEQNHEDGTGPDKNWSYLGPASYLAESARATCTVLVGNGRVSWSDVLLEEVAEAFAEDDPDRLLAELLQVEAVARQWRMAIRRRLAGGASQ